MLRWSGISWSRKLGELPLPACGEGWGEGGLTKRSGRGARRAAECPNFACWSCDRSGDETFVPAALLHARAEYLHADARASSADVGPVPVGGRDHHRIGRVERGG